MKIIFSTIIFILLSFSIYSQVISTSMNTVTICKDGTIMGWGRNDYGQVGNGNTSSTRVPATISGLTNITAVATGSFHSLYLKDDGTVWVTGSNTSGQLGDSTLPNCHTATQLTVINGVVAIAAGFEHSLFLKNDGTVWVSGKNTYGQLGDGTNIDRKNLVQIPSLSGITDISAGESHSLFVKNDGTVWSCGYNFQGQLGDGTINNRATPVKITTLSNIVDVSAGYRHSHFLVNDGSVWACGGNGNGQLGDGSITNRKTPVKIINLTNIIEIDSYNAHTVFVKKDGSVWTTGLNTYGQLGDGSTTTRFFASKISNVTNVTSASAGFDNTIILKGDGTLWACGGNSQSPLGDGTSNQTAVFINIPGVCEIKQPAKYDHFVSGIFYSDSTKDCVKQTVEKGLSNIPIIASPGNIFTFTKDSGNFNLGVNDLTNYTITPVIPSRLSYMIQNPCPLDYNVLLDATNPIDTSGFNFGFDYVPCYQLRVDVSANRKRRCAKNITKVYYINEGLKEATGVEVHVKFDRFNIPLESNLPYVYSGVDSSIVFNLDTLNIGESGSITIIDSVACINGIAGLTQCTKAWILPPNQCLIDSSAGDNWDNSSVLVSGICKNDTVEFKIKNIGSGSMSNNKEYRVYSDNVLIHTNFFQLNAGDSIVIPFAAAGNTLRLEADQSDGHPGNSLPRANVEACGVNGSGTYSTGQITQTTMDDADVDVEIYCLEIRDSYDPNYKEVAPLGVGNEKLVPPNTLMDYVIHFQNTGSDTAYQIIVTDTLASDWEISTFEPGVSSHPYSLNISGEGKALLTFTFSNINLVDSATNEPLSHGFVKFKIQPKSSTPLGTVVKNSVDIYFDYNTPVKTNTASFKIGEYFTTSVKKEDVALNGIKIFPNPASNKVNIFTTEDRINKIELYNVLAEKLLETDVNNSSYLMDISRLKNGIYFIKINTSKSHQLFKLIKN